MRKGLFRACWLLGLFVLGACGCAVDQRDVAVSETLTTADEVNKKLEEINGILRRMIEIGQASNRQGIRTTNVEISQKFGEAKKATEGLIELGRKLQNIKGYADRVSAKATPESKKELRDLNRNRLEEAIKRLEKTDRELIVSLAEADQLTEGDKDAKRQLRELRDELQKGKEVFEVVTKRR